jgi:hypothetical protein
MSSEDDGDFEKGRGKTKGCYLCQPDLYGPEIGNPDMSEDSLQEEYISNLRRKTKAQLKRTKDKTQKMKLDNDLRLSYKQNIHSNLMFGQKK